jgi:hypothetical protein
MCIAARSAIRSNGSHIISAAGGLKAGFAPTFIQEVWRRVLRGYPDASRFPGITAVGH